MSSAQTDYYAVLGLNAKAGQDEIKKRYRELARRYHPDVNHSPDAAQKIKVVNEAYHTLGDVERRATYDAGRAFQFPLPHPASTPPRPASPAPPRPDFHGGVNRGASAPGSARPAQAGRPGQRPPNAPFKPRPDGPLPPDDFGFNGFGRVIHEAAARAQEVRNAPNTAPPNAARPAAPFPGPPPAARASGAASATATDAPRRSPAQRKAEENNGRIAQLVSEAKLAFANRQYVQCSRLCREALALDRTNAIAHELLGDSARKQGNTDEAIQAYSFAIQLNPRNQSVQANLDRLMGRDEKNIATGPKMARAQSAPLVNRLGRDLVVNGMGGIAAVGMVVLVGALYVAPGAALLGDLSLNLMLTFVLCGLLGGFLLALYGGLRPQAGELTTRGGGRGLMPLSGILSLFALLWFGASLLAYIVVAVTQNRVSPSVLRAYGLTLVMSLGFVLMYHPLSGAVAGARMGYSVMVAVLSGNFLFPMILLGWRLGDALRLRSFSAS